MNYHPGGSGDFEDHPVIRQMRAELKRWEGIRQSMWRSVRINVFIMIVIGISVCLNVLVALPGAVRAIVAFWP